MTEEEVARWGFSWPTVALMALPFLLFASWIGRNIFSLSFRILEHQQNLGLDYAMGVLWWCILALGILAFGGENRGLLSVGWCAKFLVVLLGMLFYEQHYPLDAYWYYGVTVNGTVPMWPELGDLRKEFIPSFKALRDNADVFEKSPVSIENWLRAVMLVGHLAGPYYHAQKVLYAFSGLMGSWLFYRAITTALGREYHPAFYLMACFPSVIFWSSILGKDPLQFFFLGFYAYGSVMWLVEGRLLSVLYLGVGMYGSFLFRPWTAMLEGVVLVLATVLGRCRRWQRLAFLCAGLAMAGTAGGLDPATLEQLLHLDQNKAFMLKSDPTMVFDLLEERAKGMVTDTQATIGGGSGGDFTHGSVDLLDAFLAGLYRPLPFEAKNVMVLLTALDNTLLLILSLWALVKVRLVYFRDALVLWTGFYTCGWSLMYGFIVLGNFGSGARYKLQMIPFFLMFLLLIIHKEGRGLLEARLFSYQKALATSVGGRQ
ncbi:MAG: hypothetical protein FJ245_05020 [Nitrospira sp.]|nr:hypothetical protein [Nitrospira sp.]